MDSAFYIINNGTDDGHFVIRNNGTRELPYCVYYVYANGEEVLECEAISHSEAADYINEQKEQQ